MNDLNRFFWRSIFFISYFGGSNRYAWIDHVSIRFRISMKSMMDGIRFRWNHQTNFFSNQASPIDYYKQQYEYAKSLRNFLWGHLVIQGVSCRFYFYTPVPRPLSSSGNRGFITLLCFPLHQVFHFLSTTWIVLPQSEPVVARYWK